MSTWAGLVLVSLGAAVGAPLRYVVGHRFDRHLVEDRDGLASLPWGTLAVNLVGSFALGVLTGLALSEEATTLLGAGFCGGLTTYSAFAVHSHDLGPSRGTLNVLLTVPLALAACALGYALTPH